MESKPQPVLEAIAACLAAVLTGITARQSPGTWLCTVLLSSDIGDNPADHGPEYRHSSRTHRSVPLKSVEGLEPKGWGPSVKRWQGPGLRLSAALEDPYFTWHTCPSLGICKESKQPKPPRNMKNHLHIFDIPSCDLGYHLAANFVFVESKLFPMKWQFTGEIHFGMTVSGKKLVTLHFKMFLRFFIFTLFVVLSISRHVSSGASCISRSECLQERRGVFSP